MKLVIAAVLAAPLLALLVWVLIRDQRGENAKRRAAQRRVEDRD